MSPRRTLTIPVLFACSLSMAQDPVWSPDVANIIYSHCASCHHDGGIGPFSLMSYADVVSNGNVVADAVETKHMPPWPADPDYRHFADENVLTQGEIDAVVDWVNFGAPFGDPLQEPDPPVFLPGGSLLDTIDFQVAIPPYTLQYNSDEYRWFVIPNPFPTTVYVNAIEVFPGLDAVVHHADLYYDDSGTSLAYDQSDPLPGFNGNTGSPALSKYMTAWQPGGNVVRYPPQWGIAVPPGSDFVIEIHYGPGAMGQVDSTVMNLEFVTGQGIRPVSVGWLLTHGNMTDGPLMIPANTVQTFHQEWTVPSARSFLSICPHMHHLGASYKVWAQVGPDSIPLIDIPQWDFHWQRYYTFQTVQPLPAGAVVKSIGVYDNTIFNPNNPYNPPQDVYGGLTTNSEMFFTFFIWTSYQSGDEDIVLDSTIFLNVQEPQHTPAVWSVFPNPTTGTVWVGLDGPQKAGTTLEVRDALGALVLVEPVSTVGIPGPVRIDLTAVPPGVFTIQLASPSSRSVKKVLRL